jgi:hypothetical protein
MFSTFIVWVAATLIAVVWIGGIYCLVDKYDPFDPSVYDNDC